LLSRDRHAFANEDLGDNATFEMLNGLNLAARNYLALRDCDFADLRQRAPDNSGDNESGSSQECRNEQARGAAVLQHKRLGKPSRDFRSSDGWY
jgi:hypothetical protein